MIKKSKQAKTLLRCLDKTPDTPNVRHSAFIQKFLDGSMYTNPDYSDVSHSVKKMFEKDQHQFNQESLKKHIESKNLLRKYLRENINFGLYLRNFSEEARVEQLDHRFLVVNL